MKPTISMLALLFCTNLACSKGSRSGGGDDEAVDVEATVEGDTAKGMFKVSDEDQQLTVTDGALTGSKLYVQGGTFSEDVEISINKVSLDLATQDVLAMFGIEGTISNVGPTYYVSWPGGVKASKEMILLMPQSNPATGLTQASAPVVFAALVGPGPLTQTNANIGSFNFSSPNGSVDLNRPGGAVLAVPGAPPVFFLEPPVAQAATLQTDEPLDKNISSDFSIIGSFHGQEIELFADFPKEFYDRVGVKIDDNRSLAQTYKDELDANFADVPDGTTFEPTSGPRIYMRSTTGGSNAITIFATDGKRAGRVTIGNDSVDIGVMEKSDSVTYPPPTEATLQLSEFVGKYMSDTIQINASNSVEGKSHESFAFAESSGALKFTGKLLGKTVTASELLFAPSKGEDPFHQYHGGIEGWVEIDGIKRPVRGIFGLDKTSMIFATCWTGDGTNCGTEGEPVAGGGVNWIYTFAHK
jgi:hypothetical protein